MRGDGTIAAHDASTGHFRTEISELPVDPMRWANVGAPPPFRPSPVPLPARKGETKPNTGDTPAPDRGGCAHYDPSEEGLAA